MSAHNAYSAAPFNGRIELHIDRRKAVVLATGLMLGGFAIAFPPATRQSMFASGLEAGAGAIALAGAMVLLATGFFILIRISLWRGPAIVIDGFGIHDRRSGAVMTPWSCVHDIRVLDRHGGQIGIDLGATPSMPSKRRSPRLWPAQSSDRPGSLAVIDTFFLRSPTGNRILDFVLPMTALTPFDFSETPVSAETLADDAGIARRRTYALWCYIIAACVVPGVAALSIVN